MFNKTSYYITWAVGTLWYATRQSVTARRRLVLSRAPFAQDLCGAEVPQLRGKPLRVMKENAGIGITGSLTALFTFKKKQVGSARTPF